MCIHHRDVTDDIETVPAEDVGHAVDPIWPGVLIRTTRHDQNVIGQQANGTPALRLPFPVLALASLIDEHGLGPGCVPTPAETL